jgi:hypothetical protein
MEQTRDQERLTYQISRLGFGVMAGALILACLSTMLSLHRQFGGRPFIPWLQNSAFWAWIDAPIVWGSLVGSYLLWGRWNNTSWQRRSGLLVVMGTVDAVLWLIEHGQELGLITDDVGHLWLRHSLGQALGWAEFALIASLSCELMVHLGVEPAAETGKATRSLAATGAGVYMLLFWQRTDWQAGWPLGFRRLDINSMMLELGTTMIWTICLIQVTALTLAATRQCSTVLREMEREDALADPFAQAPEKKDFGWVEEV